MGPSCCKVPFGPFSLKGMRKGSDFYFLAKENERGNTENKTSHLGMRLLRIPRRQQKLRDKMEILKILLQLG